MAAATSVPFAGGELKVGDSVLVNPESPGGAPYIAYVKGVVPAGADGSGGSGEATLEVVWFYRPEEAVGGRKVLRCTLHAGGAAARWCFARRGWCDRAQCKLSAAQARAHQRTHTSANTQAQQTKQPPPQHHQHTHPPLNAPQIKPTKPFHGARELFLSDHADRCGAATVIRRCRVLSLREFQALPSIGPDDFFSRFTYRPGANEFAPDRVPV